MKLEFHSRIIYYKHLLEVGEKKKMELAKMMMQINPKYKYNIIAHFIYVPRLINIDT